MTIIYYTKKDGAITYHHKAPDADPAELEEMLKSYNSKPDDYRHGKTAHIEELPENSLAEYLFRKSEESLHYPKQCIRDALDALESAVSSIQELRPVEEKED